MYKSIADGFKVINATEGFKGFTLVSYKTHLLSNTKPPASPLLNQLLSPKAADSGQEMREGTADLDTLFSRDGSPL